MMLRMDTNLWSLGTGVSGDSLRNLGGIWFRNASLTTVWKLVFESSIQKKDYVKPVCIKGGKDRGPILLHLAKLLVFSIDVSSISVSVIFKNLFANRKKYYLSMGQAYWGQKKMYCIRKEEEYCKWNQLYRPGRAEWEKDEPTNYSVSLHFEIQIFSGNRQFVCCYSTNLVVQKVQSPLTLDLEIQRLLSINEPMIQTQMGLDVPKVGI